jgi:hypothetical protein
LIKEFSMSENNTPALNETPTPPRKSRSRSFFWPITLIAVGVLLLLSNMGIVSWNTWNLVWRFWPLVLVAIGIDVIFGNRSTLGAVLSALLVLAVLAVVAGAVFFADQLPMISRYTENAPWETAHVEHVLGDFEAAEIFIDYTSLPGNLFALEDSEYLIEGDLAYRGELVFEVDQRGSTADITLDSRFTGTWSGFQTSPHAEWEIGLTPDIPLELSLDSGSGSCIFDLSNLNVADFFLDSGSGSIQIFLPDEQSFDFRLDSGSGSLRIDLPEGTGVRVVLDSGSGSFNPGNDFVLVSGERSGDGVWESKDYDKAEYTIEMNIDQGSGSITFK